MTQLSLSPFEWVAEHLQLVGWPVLLLMAWKLRGAADRFFRRWELVDARTDATLRITEDVKSDVQAIATNHLAHIEKDISELNQKQDRTIELFQNIDKSIGILVDRQRA